MISRQLDDAVSERLKQERRARERQAAPPSRLIEPLTVGRLLDVIGRARSAIGQNHTALVQDLSDVAELCRATIGASHMGSAVDAIILEDPDTDGRA